MLQIVILVVIAAVVAGVHFVQAGAVARLEADRLAVALTVQQESTANVQAINEVTAQANAEREQELSEALLRLEQAEAATQAAQDAHAAMVAELAAALAQADAATEDGAARIAELASELNALTNRPASEYCVPGCKVRWDAGS